MDCRGGSSDFLLEGPKRKTFAKCWNSFTANHFKLSLPLHNLGRLQIPKQIGFNLSKIYLV